MHHVRKIRDLKSKARVFKMDFFTMQVAAVNRKQIPLCKFHHTALHRNSLYPLEREQLKTEIKQLKGKY